MASPLDELLTLSHRIGGGAARSDLAILGEGNTSARTGPDTFIVKASGSSLETLSAEQVTECRIAPLLAMLDAPPGAPDADVDRRLLDARVDPASRKPSVEAYFHAYLLTLPGVAFVAHAHPNAVNGVLCTRHATDFARQRQCPDEVVCCGGESLLIPYVDPGLALAREIRTSVRGFIARTARPPRVILLANHGVICPASSAAGALAALLMTVKAADVFTRAVALGGPLPLPAADIARLDARPDEDYRRAALGL